MVGDSTLIITTTPLLLIYFYGPTVGAKFGMRIHLFPPSAKRYGEIAIEIIDSNAYYADSEECDIQKEIALNEMKTLASYEKAYPIIDKIDDILIVELPAILDAQSNGENTPKLF